MILFRVVLPREYRAMKKVICTWWVVISFRHPFFDDAYYILSNSPYQTWLTNPYIELILLCPKLANINWALCQTFSCPTINHTWIELLLLCLTHQQTSIELRMVATSTSTTIAKPQVSSVFDAIIFQYIQLFIHKQLRVNLNQTFFILKCWW